MRLHTKSRYLTNYGPGLNSYVWAKNWAETYEVCRKRHLGENVVCQIANASKNPHYLPASQILTGRLSKLTPYSLIERIHALTFLGYLGSMCGLVDSQEFISDTGILHEWVHLEQARRDNPKLRKQLLTRIRAVESLIPGYLP